ncbi:ethanolamine utilization protein EutN/carboxysome structural protein Ccml [Salmonella enterica]|nr:ethanolamine utilization protein EutN/carboxysome structural protein Ccml [Salmonella enterica]
MHLARVTGAVVSTQKSPSLVGKSSYWYAESVLTDTFRNSQRMATKLPLTP